MIKTNIGLGTAAIGRPQYINIRKEESVDYALGSFRQKGINVLNAAYEQGVRYFDTAPGYGMAEQLILDWALEKKDSEIEVATKWGYTYVADFDPNATEHEIKEHSLEKLNEQWEQSKKLLPKLSTYQIHSATLETGVLENVAILNRLAELKHLHGLKIGLSSTGKNQLAVIEKALELKLDGVFLFDVFQVTYNMFDQSLAQVIQQNASADKRFIIKEALANGRVFPNESYRHYEKAYKTLQLIATKYNVGLDAIALRFCIDTVRPYSVLSGAANEDHLSANLKALQFELSEEDLEMLKKALVSPKQYWSERKKLAWN